MVLLAYRVIPKDTVSKYDTNRIRFYWNIKYCLSRFVFPRHTSNVMWNWGSLFLFAYPRLTFFIYILYVRNKINVRERDRYTNVYLMLKIIKKKKGKLKKKKTRVDFHSLKGLFNLVDRTFVRGHIYVYTFWMGTNTQYSSYVNNAWNQISGRRGKCTQPRVMSHLK